MTNQPGSQFFSSMRHSLPARTTDRWIGGVCAGWAARWGIDPLIVRGGLVILTVVAGVGLVLYALGWLLMPEHDGRIHLQEAVSGRFDPAQVGAGVMLFMGLFNPGIWYLRRDHWFFSLLATVAVVAVAVVAIRSSSPTASSPSAAAPASSPASPESDMPLNSDIPHDPAPGAPAGPALETEPLPAAGFEAVASPTPASSPPQTPGQPPVQPPGQFPANSPAQSPDGAPAAVSAPSDPRATRIILALSLLVIAAAVALRTTDWQPFGTASVNVELLTIGALLVVLGLGVLVAAFRRRSAGSVGVIGTLVLILAAIPAMGFSQASTSFGPWVWTSSSSYGAAHWQPMTPQEAMAGYSDIAMGDVNATLPAQVLAGVEEIEISLGVGELSVVLPADVPIQVEASTGIGAISVDYPRSSGFTDQSRGGLGTNLMVRSPAAHDAAQNVAPVIINLSTGVGEISISFED